MASRMDKYRDEQIDVDNSIGSRMSKNENLYKKLYTNKVFTEFSNANFDNVVDLSDISMDKTVNKREEYQKSRLMVSDDVNMLDSNDFSLVSKDDAIIEENEVNYNINDVLENARKTRTIEDDIEKKRRLKSVEYSILSDLSQEKLKEYHDNKKKKLTKDEEENLEELIHTITSNSLRKKIDDELLGDLLPTKESETLVSKELFDKLEEIDAKTRDLKDELEEENKMDNSFYTKSMDLSKEDFVSDDLEDDYSFLEDSKMGIFSKLLIGLFLIIVILIIVYILYRFI